MPSRRTFLLFSLTCAPFLFSSCAVFDALRPGLTEAAHVLLVELDELLTTYESASISKSADPGSFLVFNASQDALYRDISELLTQCTAFIPANVLQPYRNRLSSAHVYRP
ncbi:hypothetical protein LCGC14_1410660 [marine sediment metagenome]|uniref:Uncharacterized protein n=1 Tax=marine sediment metagenome TaxID=412755 RepID=A0A0F9JUG3_9ZZZZ